MRNYLFDRSVVTIKEQKARKRKKRWLFWLLTSVGLAAGALAVFLMGPYLFAPPPAPEAESQPELEIAEETGRENWREPTIRRAPVGDGTELTICTEERETLSAGAVYEKALPSVVSVQALRGNKVSVGSGVIMSENGYVLTNYHIIQGTSGARVFLLSTGEGFEAQLVGWEEDLDLAVLKIEAEDLVPAEFGDSRSLLVGDNVFALGNPLGYLYGSLTEGIVSAPTRSVDMEGTAMTLIQISAPINLGNSGGALLNERGQVVGITSAKMTGKRDNVDVEGVGLALPISEIRNEINSIIQNGRVITPRIGIMCYEAVFDDVGGVLVDAVTEGDPAEKAGIRPGDFITHVNGVPFGTLDGLKDELYRVGVDGEAVLSVMRGTEKLELTVILAG